MTTTYWGDGSPSWLKIFAALDVEPWERLTLHLAAREVQVSEAISPSSVQVHRTGNYWHVDTDKIHVRIVASGFTWTVMQDSGSGKHEVEHEILFTDDAGEKCRPEIDNEWKPVQVRDGVLILEAQGHWRRADDNLIARVTCRLHFLADSETVAVETCLHNPQRAHHAGGLWDLGDPGSVHFTSLEIRASLFGSERVYVKPEVHGEAVSVPVGEALQLYQDSSGGEHWDSRNHIDFAGNSTVHFRGYQLASDNEIVSRGARATPIGGLTGPGGSVWGSLRQFWQNFPSALDVRKDKLTLGLFPASGKPYELQGGERKTHKAYLNYGDDPEALNWTQAPLIPVIDTRHFEQAEAFPWFKVDREPDALDFLIRRGVEGPRNFFVKREQIDEYGWRNFGDVFADHETHYQKSGEEPLISHYNNQYDAIYGFARQFALTGDRRWFELMDDLAKHVTDIDIYHTKEDRIEYNGGLFWHTDHYLDAHTATHRTFTCHNTSSSTPGQTGGGPASEHCYTTGLLYHYYLTGSDASRDAVLQLANWMTAAHEGQGGLLEQLLALKKHEIPKLKLMLRGERLMPHRYPFTRGTGNYLNALLDAWLLEPLGPWLERAESVIRDTIHPGDNIDQRDLLNVETGWSYLILLASVVRYLALKEEVDEKDETYRYALESFLRYAAWMRTNERPFLADPEQLEFPNDTWVAQDVRKAMLMFQAASYDTGNAEAYHAKGQEWLDYVCDRLENSSEAEYARILIILMQNYGPQHLEPATEPVPAGLDVESTRRQPTLTWRRLITRMAQRIARGFLTFHPRREKAWLSARLDST
ncbi:MAG: hypothetical protein ACX936_04805 [Marinobacter sp.]